MLIPASAVYMVFFANFGPHYHIFTLVFERDNDTYSSYGRPWIIIGRSIGTLRLNNDRNLRRQGRGKMLKFDDRKNFWMRGLLREGLLRIEKKYRLVDAVLYKTFSDMILLVAFN